MRTVLKVILIASVILTMVGCKAKTVFVPVETVKVEYRDKLIRDSIHQLDSIYVDRYSKGDTVFINKEKYKYVYKDKIIKDTVAITDSIQVPYPIKGDPIPYVTGWQNFQIWLGRIALFLLFIYLGYRFIRLKFLS